MIQFSRLRLNGFKSFVDRTELEIAPGLNGIVGPNGCGKSNLVEALRWVMGENSAKRMRGDGMEDVIFNGTSQRSKRNIAEVSLLLDNSTRTAPAAYNGLDEIEVVRKIERDHGSNYKINGKNVRMRDVQMLFADTVTGANSPAMVSQGRITQMINAKPHERRIILEESAGISGLYARRHEAELRLKAADANLLRIEDILGSMEGRLNGLKRQARQATKYRNLSTQIRQMEILIAYMEWQMLDQKMQATRATFDAAESLVAEKLGAVTQLTKTQTTQSEDLPALRQKEAEIASALQAQKIALQRIEDEAGRIAQNLAETQEQLERTTIDLEHETFGLKENAGTLERIDQEFKDITEEQKSEEGKLKEKDDAREELEQKVTALEERYNLLMKGAAEARAQREAYEQRIKSNEQRLETITARRDTNAAKLEEVKAARTGETQDFANIVTELEQAAEQTARTIETTQSEVEKLAKAIETARESLTELESKKAEFNTEISMLESFLKDDSEEFAPLVSKVSPDQGFEKALSRALGDSLMASLDEKAKTLWLEHKNPFAALPDLPVGAEPLLPHVKAPKALDAALSQIGVVEDFEAGSKIWENLKPGQALVSKDGNYWRWDGFAIKAEATDRHAQTLEQQNKLKSLIKKRPQIEDLVSSAKSNLEKTLMQHEASQKALKELREKKREQDSDLNKIRNEWASEREANARVDGEIARLEDVVRIAQEDLAELEKSLIADRIALKAYENDSETDQETQLEELRTVLVEARQSLSEAVRAYDMYVQKQNTRKARMQAIADERVNLQNRSIRSRERIGELEERKKTLEEKLAEIKAQPKDFEDDKTKLLEKISQTEALRSDAADALARVETEVHDTTRALKEAEAELGSAREARAHAQATFSAQQEQQGAMEAAIFEKFEMKPTELPAHSAIDMDKDLGDLDSLKSKKEKLSRERDSIGPVNLRADEEAQALEVEVTALLNERNDLTQAIDELRGGIQKINKEARERLQRAFDHVNAHFQNLFGRLFNGGSAHLALIDTDSAKPGEQTNKDPLAAGLEIYAQPPGKALQSLSLLSGGEQTMASIALIFAMFLTNPSPICVLDEIDAPLDDANVDRVCDLLDDIAERGETRFLIITHHRLTMARMDRLYGVTMAERGVSQLVSVDLQQSFSFLDEAA